MTVHVDELATDVTVAPEPADGGTAAAGGASSSPWDAAEAFRAHRDRAARDAARTRAEGYGD